MFRRQGAPGYLSAISRCHFMILLLTRITLTLEPNRYLFICACSDTFVCSVRHIPICWLRLFHTLRRVSPHNIYSDGGHCVYQSWYSSATMAQEFSTSACKLFILTNEQPHPVPRTTSDDVQSSACLTCFAIVRRYLP